MPAKVVILQKTIHPSIKEGINQVANRIVGSVTSDWLTTVADSQTPHHASFRLDDAMSVQIGLSTLGAEMGGQRCQCGLVTPDELLPCPEAGKHPMLPYIGAAINVIQHRLFSHHTTRGARDHLSPQTRECTMPKVELLSAM